MQCFLVALDKLANALEDFFSILHRDLTRVGVREYFGTGKSILGPCWAPFITVLTTAILASLFTTLYRSKLWSSNTAVIRADRLQRSCEVLHSLVTTAGSVICFCRADFDNPAWIYDYNLVDEVFPSILMGWLIFDTGFNVVFWKTLWETSDVIHHILFGGLTAVHLWLGCSHYKMQYLWLAVGELIVPFQQARWLLASQGRKDTLAYATNNVVLLVVFFLTRPILYPLGLLHFLHLMWNVWDAVPVDPRLNHCVLASISAGLMLNAVWFMGLLRAVLRNKRRRRQSRLRNPGLPKDEAEQLIRSICSKGPYLEKEPLQEGLIKAGRPLDRIKALRQRRIAGCTLKRLQGWSCIGSRG